MSGSEPPREEANNMTAKQQAIESFLQTERARKDEQTPYQLEEENALRQRNQRAVAGLDEHKLTEKASMFKHFDIDTTTYLKSEESAKKNPSARSLLKPYILGIATVDVRFLDAEWPDNRTASNRRPDLEAVRKLVKDMELRGVLRTASENRLITSCTKIEFDVILKHTLSAFQTAGPMFDPFYAEMDTARLRALTGPSSVPAEAKDLGQAPKLLIPTPPGALTLEAGQHRQMALLDRAAEILSQQDRAAEDVTQSREGDDLFGWMVIILDQEALYRDHAALLQCRVNRALVYQPACPGDVLLNITTTLTNMSSQEAVDSMFFTRQVAAGQEKSNVAFRKLLIDLGGDSNSNDHTLQTIKAAVRSPVTSCLVALCQMQCYRKRFTWTLAGEITSSRIPEWHRVWLTSQLDFIEKVFGDHWKTLSTTDMAMLAQVAVFQKEDISRIGEPVGQTRVRVRDIGALNALFYPTRRECKGARHAVISHMAAADHDTLTVDTFDHVQYLFTGPDPTHLALMGVDLAGSVRRPGFLSELSEPDYHHAHEILASQSPDIVSRELMQPHHVLQQASILGPMYKSYLLFFIFCCHPTWVLPDVASKDYYTISLFEVLLNCAAPLEPIMPGCEDLAAAVTDFQERKDARNTQMILFLTFIERFILDASTEGPCAPPQRAALKSLLAIPSDWHGILNHTERTTSSTRFHDIIHDPWVTPVIQKYLEIFGSQRFDGIATCISNPRIFKGKSVKKEINFGQNLVNTYQATMAIRFPNMPPLVMEPIIPLLESTVQAVVLSTEFEYLTKQMSWYEAAQAHKAGMNEEQWDRSYRHLVIESGDPAAYIHNMFTGDQPDGYMIANAHEYELVAAARLTRAHALEALGYEGMLAHDARRPLSYRYGTLQSIPSFPITPIFQWKNSQLAIHLSLPTKTPGMDNASTRKARRMAKRRPEDITDDDSDEDDVHQEITGPFDTPTRAPRRHREPPTIDLTVDPMDDDLDMNDTRLVKVRREQPDLRVPHRFVDHVHDPAEFDDTLVETENRGPFSMPHMPRRHPLAHHPGHSLAEASYVDDEVETHPSFLLSSLRFTNVNLDEDDHDEEAEERHGDVSNKFRLPSLAPSEPFDSDSEEEESSSTGPESSEEGKEMEFTEADHYVAAQQIIQEHGGFPLKKTHKAFKRAFPAEGEANSTLRWVEAVLHHKPATNTRDALFHLDEFVRETELQRNLNHYPDLMDLNS